MGQIRGQKFYVMAGLIEVTSVQIIIYIYEFVMYFYEIVVYMNHEYHVYLLFRGQDFYILLFWRENMWDFHGNLGKKNKI